MESPHIGELRGCHGAYVTQMKIWIQITEENPIFRDRSELNRMFNN